MRVRVDMTGSGSGVYCATASRDSGCYASGMRVARADFVSSAAWRDTMASDIA